MSAQREAACLNQLRRACTLGGIFGQGSSRTWQSAYETSYLSGEKAGAQADLNTVRRTVRDSLARELPLISVREEMLLQRMMIFGGSSPVFEQEEYAPALSLIRRLWCTARQPEGGGVLLTVPTQLSSRMARIMQRPDYQQSRQKMFTLTATLHSLLYLDGFFFAQALSDQFPGAKLPDSSPLDALYLNRFLMSEFDYVWNAQREMILVHPGLSRPEEIISPMSGTSYQEPHFSHQMILDGMREMLEEERPAVEALRAELEGALQPQYPADETVNDLKLLAKQGASVEDLQTVLSEKMATVFHPGILSALRRLHSEVVPWPGVSHGVLN